MKQSGSLSNTDTVKSLMPVCLISEEVLSVGICESPRQFNQQPQFDSMIHVPEETLSLSNPQQSQSLSFIH